MTDGFHAALERARDAASDLDIAIGGGVSRVRQYLRAGLIDEMHFASKRNRRDGGLTARHIVMLS